MYIMQSDFLNLKSIEYINKNKNQQFKIIKRHTWLI